MERRLAAIMATDVVGYSRLIRSDEEGTLAALKALRTDLIDPKIAEHHGRVVKLMGDGMLAEFASAVDAVRAAVETQRAVAKRNADLPEDKRIAFRVGINLGDVVVDGDDIHGDGVNVAARLEGLAEAGGICISGGVYDQVRDRIDFPFEDLGEHQVKNIDRPVRVWRWSEPTRAGSTVSGSESLPLPDKPSIAVLPFTNMSGDPEQKYFSDGLTEDIITELSRFRQLFVIARNSSFTYKGQAINVQAVGRELGVRYVVEGSVRKAGNRLRINAQLVDSLTGHHLWAERYDRQLVDIFDLQDEITQSIVSALSVMVAQAERKQAQRKDPVRLEAYDYCLRGQYVLLEFSREKNAKALRFYEKAIELDPTYSMAYAGMAWARHNEFRWGWCDTPEASLNLALVAARKAIALDDSNHEAHFALCAVHLSRGEHDAAITEYKRAILYNPNDADLINYFALVLIYSGQPEEALQYTRKAMRLNPHYIPQYPLFLGRAYYGFREYEKAIVSLKEAVDLNPDFLPPHRMLACAFAQLGRSDEAKAEAGEVLRIDPTFTIAGEQALPFRKATDLEHYLDGLRKAGLPE